MSTRPYKPVTLKTDTQWTPLKHFADELAAETNMRVSLPDAIMFAVKFTRDNRFSLAGTPGGEVSGNAADVQAQPKGVITN